MGAAKAIDKEINNYLGHLNNHQKEVVLNVVKTLANEEDEWWDKVEDAATTSIKKGLKEAKEGKTAPHESVMKKYAGWLSK